MTVIKIWTVGDSTPSTFYLSPEEAADIRYRLADPNGVLTFEVGVDTVSHVPVRQVTQIDVVDDRPRPEDRQ